MIELLIAIGDAFGFEIPNSVANAIVTVQDVVDYIQKRSGEERRSPSVKTLLV
jgi:acyl carrier protein